MPGPQYTGWGGGWSDETGEVVGNLTYDALVWVDEDGRIIGRQDHEPDQDESRVFDGGNDTIMTMGGGSYGDRLWYIGDVTELALPCPGVAPGDIEDAELALIYGYGPSSVDMTWHVYFPERG